MERTSTLLCYSLSIGGHNFFHRHLDFRSVLKADGDLLPDNVVAHNLAGFVLGLDHFPDFREALSTIYAAEKSSESVLTLAFAPVSDWRAWRDDRHIDCNSRALWIMMDAGQSLPRPRSWWLTCSSKGRCWQQVRETRALAVCANTMFFMAYMAGKNRETRRRSYW